MPMNREELLAELRRLNGAAALAEHEWHVSIDVMTRAMEEHRTAAHGDVNEAAARFEGARAETQKRQQRFLEALTRVWVVARRVAG